MKPRELLVFLSNVRNPVAPEVVQAVLGLQTPASRPCWKEALDLSRRDPESGLGKQNAHRARTNFARLLAAADLGVLEEAFVIHPRLLARHARDVTARALAKAALVDSTAGRLLEKVVPEAKRQALARQIDRDAHLSKSQRLALELALFFHPPATRLFLFLICRAWRSEERDRDGRAFDDLYRTYLRPKKSGGAREICVPRDELKFVQRKILDKAFGKAALSGAVHGFRKGHSIVSNALPHCGKQVVLNLDIDSFFPSVAFPLIARACWQELEGQLSPSGIFLVAQLCSFRGALPTGAPTSPAIANIVLRGVDRALEKVCARRGMVYTRYADDLTFSGNGNVAQIIPFVGKFCQALAWRSTTRRSISTAGAGGRWSRGSWSTLLLMCLAASAAACGPLHTGVSSVRQLTRTGHLCRTRSFVGALHF